MIYDCFLFFNELDLLDIRFNILDPVVDRFVIAEATRTFTNNEKLLYFAENRERYAQFLDKIIYIKIDTYPKYETPWA
ncbi:MAG: glycosyl transferase GT17 family protein, partial [Lachnoclostridium sp.]|nr:glycosyl transferase GT17 family protein [Lachnoclostridium sp.]